MATEFGRRSEPQPAVGQFKTELSHSQPRDSCSASSLEVRDCGSMPCTWAELR